MKIPARAPSTPARHDPSRLVTRPTAFSSAVASPKYQTLPRLSCAYQSFVRSARRPPTETRSSTSVQRTPRMSWVRFVTVTTSRPRLPSFSPTYTSVVPGLSGNHGLSTVRTKPAAGVARGLPPPAEPHATQARAARRLVARNDRNDLAVRGIDTHFLVADVDAVDDRTAEVLEIHLAEGAGGRALSSGDSCRQGDPRLRQELLPVVQRPRLRVVTIVPDEASRPAERERCAREDGQRDEDSDCDDPFAHVAPFVAEPA